jgi:3-deoxy-D-manno-octulosonate 8-phosphate phosphatase KdsC-like HAD superfamily phosphatase
MLSTTPQVLALDFDGVICDGLIEYFQTTQKAYLKLWPQDSISPDYLATSFYKLRPVIETGWEMPVLLRALVLGESESEILENWPEVLGKIVQSEKLDKRVLGETLDGVRDEWIESDLTSWLGLHKFYGGVIERLKTILLSDTKIYIISTKEGRFIQTLLAEQGINISDRYLIGKESKRPKYETIQDILIQESIGANQLWFVEDRLKALELVQQRSELAGVGLFLADWGYNTQQTRDSLQNTSAIHLLSLTQFTQDFPQWYLP